MTDFTQLGPDELESLWLTHTKYKLMLEYQKEARFEDLDSLLDELETKGDDLDQAIVENFDQRHIGRLEAEIMEWRDENNY